MITAKVFWKGRDVQYASDLTDAIRIAAAETIVRANQLLTAFYAANPTAHQRDANSGWRPPAVNANTNGAAVKSLHMIGKAVDIEDDDEKLDTWLMSDAGQSALAQFGLWMEHPSKTPRWAHVQTKPPGSGRRVFMP